MCGARETVDLSERGFFVLRIGHCTIAPFCVCTGKGKRRSISPALDDARTGLSLCSGCDLFVSPLWPAAHICRAPPARARVPGLGLGFTRSSPLWSVKAFVALRSTMKIAGLERKKSIKQASGLGERVSVSQREGPAPSPSPHPPAWPRPQRPGVAQAPQSRLRILKFYTLSSNWRNKLGEKRRHTPEICAYARDTRGETGMRRERQDHERQKVRDACAAPPHE